MCLDMLLQILWTLERLVAKLAFVWLKRYMYSHMGSDVISFDGSDATQSPLTGKIEVVGGLATDMLFANMILMWSAS